MRILAAKFVRDFGAFELFPGGVELDAGKLFLGCGDGPGGWWLRRCWIFFRLKGHTKRFERCASSMTASSTATGPSCILLSAVMLGKLAAEFMKSIMRRRAGLTFIVRPRIGRALYWTRYEGMG